MSEIKRSILWDGWWLDVGLVLIFLVGLVGDVYQAIQPHAAVGDYLGVPNAIALGCFVIFFHHRHRLYRYFFFAFVSITFAIRYFKWSAGQDDYWLVVLYGVCLLGIT